MIRKWSFSPFISTGAVIREIEPESSPLPYFEHIDGRYRMTMTDSARIYGLGESVRGINKRGWKYISYCSDEPNHTEDRASLYGAHNFLIIDDGKDCRFGIFFDCPGKITFDLGYTEYSTIDIIPEKDHLDIYIIEEDTLKNIVRAFRFLIGRSYIPPFFAFGYGQSRWGYVSEKDIREVEEKHRNAGIPLDMIYLDIDYMEDFQDFTVSHERFPDLKTLSSDLKARGVRLIPIIDAAVKVKDGYPIYEEGKEKGFFCQDENGGLFITAVWPGRSVLPDFLNPQAREWFGSQYKKLIDLGIEGFWNDMNEPALFYSEKGLNGAFEKIKEFEGKNLGIFDYFTARNVFSSLANADSDYKSFYHQTESGKLRHHDIHNLYGYNMTRSAYDAISKINEGKRPMLFSRASMIGAHRYGGIWTGDNHAWWSHLLQSIKQMPSLNMCGFLYTGSDIGGFGSNCTRDLLLRWLAFALFTPLMRNHAAAGTRRQEAYAFGETEEFKHIITLRYRLLPYIYSEFMKAALRDEMYFRPLSFDYTDDPIACETEDQLMVGEAVMIAPVYTQNATGRMVYLPEEMTMVRMHSGEFSTEELSAGHHYLSVPLSDVVFFIRKGYAIPLCEPASCTDALDYNTIRLIGTGDTYELYRDDGISSDVSLENIEIIKKASPTA